MIKSKPKKKDKYVEKLLKKSYEISNTLEELQNKNLSIKMSLNFLNNSLQWFRIKEPTYDEIYYIASMNLGLVLLSDLQEIIIKEIAEEICTIVPLHDYIILGFIKRGIIKWQLDNNLPILCLSKMNSFEKLKTMANILTYASIHICKAFYSPNKIWKEQLQQEVFHLAIDRYEEIASAQDMLINNEENSELFVNTAELT